MDVIDQYLGNFDTHQKTMAASEISLTYCQKFIIENGLKGILDAGSGLSSIVFHSHFQEVTTIDDNARWAAVTEQQIKTILNKEILINPIENIPRLNFDFIFYDYGHIETRIFYFKAIMKLCDKYMYIDDMHVSFYRDYIISRAKPHKLLILEKETKDEFGRFGAILEKVGKV